MHTLESELWLPVPRERIFAFFSDAFQLQAITPPAMRMRVVTPAPIEIRQGTTIDYQLRVRGLPLRWRSLISVWEPPERFVDEQLRGPYRHWRHEHTFLARDGGTLVVDRVEYAVRLAWLTHRWLVRPDLERIFEYRRQKLVALFGAP
jgi:ligand-binding SRPBCC domain-containing protein